MLAGVGIIALFPIMMVITALLYGLGFNHPIFTQQRVGQGGRVFTILKFRTLRDQTCRPVSRLTSRLAKTFTSALRVSGFDELPQLFNIASGEMSLVGPRPHSLADHVQFSNSIAGYEARLAVKPGITGWAQICGWRGPVTTIDHLDARISHDLAYIKHGNIAFDGAILIATALLPLLPFAKLIRPPRPTKHRFIQRDRQHDGRIA
ncbi:MAG: sugar transferase [Rhodospirillales bacterium]|nr:sugar transferase [Rhodospirillales bacterium]